MRTKYTDMVDRRKNDYGDMFDDTNLTVLFRCYYASELRIKVQYGDTDYIRTGTVGVTTGWKPSFLLMHRSSDMGSSDVLTKNYKIIAVWNGKKYV